MASVTSWMRLEPIPRTPDLEPALQAQVADPLWLLARQWQTLEFAGEDAGSPIVARVTADASRLDRVSFGGSEPISYDDLKAPLEAAVEAEQYSPAGSERLRVDAGLHFLRLLARHGAPAMRDRYIEHYAFVPGNEPAPIRAAGFRTLAGGRAPDGARLHADLAAHRGSAASLTDLPDAPNIPDAARQAVVDAANAWLNWYEHLFTAPGEGAWDPAHMEYTFHVGAATATGQIELAAGEYHGGHPDWHTFALHQRTEEPQEAVTRRIVRTVIPTPAGYAGMPVDRFWQFEDGRISFGAIDAGPSDLTRLVLVEFALVFGNDWFVIPVDLEVGSVCTIESLEVIDTFGVVTTVDPVADGDGWSMFRIRASRTGDATAETPAMFLPPVMASTIESDPVESVTLLRDEMANMVWGVERKVLGPTGDVVDRDDTSHPPALGLQQVEGDITDAELVYRLATPVPDHWIPFVPVPSTDHDGVVLERRILHRTTPEGIVDVFPQGRILEPGRPLRIEEEEVPREGAIVERTFQLARWTDGSTHLWLGRRKRVGRGEGRSGLRFDVVERPLDEGT